MEYPPWNDVGDVHIPDVGNPFANSGGFWKDMPQNQQPQNNIPVSQSNSNPIHAGPGQSSAAPGGDFAKGGKVPALVSPGEKVLGRKEVTQVMKDGKNPMEVGKTVPGKPKVPGAKNSYANDTVKASLDEGGFVIPRSITQGPNPHWEALKFMRQHMKSSK